MKQVSQNMRSGELKIEEVPEPALLPGGVLVRNAFSLISAGTERQKLEMGRKSLLGKARARPDLVKKVYKKFRTEGFAKTAQTVRARLDAPSPLGYSCAGVAEGIAQDVAGIVPGDRVACAGANYAVHSEVVWVPANLCVAVPDGVSLRQASLTTVGAIALQGVRQADLRLGETALVLGLGLIGQISAMLLESAGCRVIGADLNRDMVEMARRGGLERALGASGDDLAQAVAEWTGGHGADATIVCASTPSSEPVAQAAELTRDRGRVVVVGLVGMDIPREPFYMKEIELRLSRSYGPGRYDPAYEEGGRDYPYGYVRWTEQRNMECFLDLVARKAIDVDRILTHDFPFDSALEAYDLVSRRDELYLGITLNYGLSEKPRAQAPPSPRARSVVAPGRIGVAAIGAGNYAQANLLPVLREMGEEIALVAACDAQGLVAANVRTKFGFLETADGVDSVLGDDRVEWVVIATRHNTHADLAARALRAGKHVHVEKPLALSLEELDAVCAAHGEGSHCLTVGFNRRFAPATARALDFLRPAAGPRMIAIRVNAGQLEPGHWLLDPEIGGGRLIGEGCHFIDLACCLAGGPPRRVAATAARSVGNPRAPRTLEDVIVTMDFEDGSAASIVYCSQGDSSLPKERIEVMAGGRHVVIDDFRAATYSAGGRADKKTWRPQDKGQRAMLEAEVHAMRQGGEPPISMDSLSRSTRASLAAVESLRTGLPIDPQAEDWGRAPEELSE